MEFFHPRINGANKWIISTPMSGVTHVWWDRVPYRYYTLTPGYRRTKAKWVNTLWPIFVSEDWNPTISFRNTQKKGYFKRFFQDFHPFVLPKAANFYLSIPGILLMTPILIGSRTLVLEGWNHQNRRHSRVTGVHIYCIYIYINIWLFWPFRVFFRFILSVADFSFPDQQLLSPVHTRDTRASNGRLSQSMAQAT